MILKLANFLKINLFKFKKIDFLYGTNGCTEQTVPVTDAGTDQIMPVGSVVPLDAFVSYDPFEDDDSGGSGALYSLRL